MASTYSDKLRLELMTTGEKSGTWGTITNTNLGTLLEEAICGYVSVTHDDSASYTLTTNDGATDEARNMVVNVAGTLSQARNVVCPTKEKLYVVKNATTGGYKLTFKTSGGTGVDVPNGYTMILYCDGTNVLSATTTLQSTFRLVDSTDVTKQIAFDVSGVTTATTRTITFPDASMTLVGTTATQTLTNKTLTSPTITGATLTTATITTPTLTLANSASPTPTTEGDIQWDSDDNKIVVGDGAAQKIFVPTASVSGDVTMTVAGVATVASASDSAAGKVELATDAETQTGTDTARAITPANLTAKEASAANYRANTADRILTTDIVWSAADTVALSWTASGTTAVDLSTGINFTVTTATGNSTLGAPTNAKTGQSGFIYITQDGSTPRTLAYASAWVFAGGTDPTLTATASAKDILFYQVIDDTGPIVFGNLVKGVA